MAVIARDSLSGNRRQRLTRRVLLADERHRIDFEDMRFNPRYSQIAGQFQLIRSRAAGDQTLPASATDEARSGTPLAATTPDWRDSVEWDFIWLHLRGRDESLATEPPATPGGVR